MPLDALLFVGHGSKDPEGNEEVRKFVESLKSEVDSPIVETCFLEFAQPDIAAGIGRCVERGASKVAVVPIILLAAGHAKLHIPAAIDEAKRKYPHVTFTYGRPVGVHEQALHILSARLREAGIDIENEPAETAVLIVGRGSSDPDANSDLYKISRLFWERCKVKWVETAFIGVTYPLLEEGVERCLRLGARHVVILPYFLFTGVLMKRMEQMVQAYRARYPDRRFSLANYFGFHPELKKILLERAREALAGEAKMNCALCRYRIMAMREMDHHHHHHHHDGDDHRHDHEHHHHHT